MTTLKPAHLLQQPRLAMGCCRLRFLRWKRRLAVLLAARSPSHKVKKTRTTRDRMFGLLYRTHGGICTFPGKSVQRDSKTGSMKRHGLSVLPRASPSLLPDHPSCNLPPTNRIAKQALGFGCSDSMTAVWVASCMASIRISCKTFSSIGSTEWKHDFWHLSRPALPALANNKKPKFLS